MIGPILRSLALIFLLSPTIGTVAPTAVTASSSKGEVAGAELPQNCEVVGQIIKTGGQVWLKRRHQSGYQLASVGTRLCRGDRLKPSAGAAAIVGCEGSSRRARLPDGLPSGVTNLCPQKPLSTSSEVFRSGDEDDPGIPLIINFGKILNDRPILRWYPAEDAQIYRVQLRGGDIDWETQVSDTKVIYDGQPLQPGETYALKVTAIKTDNSQAFSSVPLSLISLAEAQAVAASQKQIVSGGEESEAQALALAQLYLRHNLKVDALEILRGVAEKGSQNSEIYRAIAKIYEEMELRSLADAYYLQADEP